MESERKFRYSIEKTCDTGNLISYTNTDTPRNGSTCIHMDLYLLLALIAYAQTEVFLGKLDTDSSTLIKHNNSSERGML